jgi:hypothetical protein
VFALLSVCFSITRQFGSKLCGAGQQLHDLILRPLLSHNVQGWRLWASLLPQVWRQAFR